MRILITGGTGFIGQHLVQRCVKRGHEVVVYTRSPEKSTYFQDHLVTYQDHLPEPKIADINAVVNLAGEPIFGTRWSKKQKKKLIKSRTGTTQTLGKWIQSMPHAPQVFVNASAIGYYGTQSKQTQTSLDESATPTKEFMSIICQEWEKTVHAIAAKHTNMRVIIFRFGVVLGANGGALSRMAMPIRYGLGGKIGDGQQVMSWVHIDDVIGAIEKAIYTSDLEGTYNLTSPNPVTNQEMTRAIGKILKRPTILTMPEFVMDKLLGEQADLLTKGQRVVPKKLEATGFRFRYAELDKALRQCLID